ncbi:reticulon-1b isoform X1 [Pimephales promelas]|uniref:reticulon-1b isoform X1 n=1 Tax=Pimephales promelas TaxID=90988 RepID=UPI001955A246|nr:reticulon-1b isoform X1 [Pimephales promelas]KAG1964242.1 reticulon-1 [Pimephales promelas]
MSEKPETGSERSWYGDDFEEIGRFGSTTTARRDDLGEGRQMRDWEDESSEEKQFSSHPESDRQPLPVVMETSSTDKSDSNFQKKSTDDGDDLYTFLLSNQSYGSHEDPSYFSGSTGRSGDKHTSRTDDFISGSHSLTLTSVSSIEIKSSADPTDSSHKIHDSEKAFHSSYNYMDISHKEVSCSSQRSLEDWRMSGLSEPTQYTKLEKSPSPVEVDVEDIGSAEVLDSQTFPYVEEPSDEELSDYQPYRSPGTGSSASPVKITLTETPPTSVSPTTVQHSPTFTVSEKESILSLGLEGVPTVTLSEAEDESPESSTPPTEDSDSPSEPNILAGETKIMSSFQDKTQTSSTSPSQPASKQDGSSIELKTSPPKPSMPLSSQDVDGSSAESGNSEIEMVSEEPSPQAPSSGYMSFSKSPSTAPSTTATVPVPSSTSVFAPNPTMQYSILREEREAELDSELALESCGEESPKKWTHNSTKGFKESPQLVKKPATLTNPTKEPIMTPTTPTPTVPAPTSASKEKASTMEEKPKPSSTTPSPSLPELKVEHPAGEVHQKERRRSSQGRRGSGRMTVPPVVFQGLSREKAMELLYWRNLKQSGLVFGSLLLLLFSLTQFSVVSVVAYLALAALSATISFRVYKSVLQAVQKTDEGHPFKAYLDVEMSLSHDQMQKYAENIQYYINSSLKELRRLFLVQDLVDSLKFAVLMWLLTYVGALFNGLTLLIMVVVSMFSMPVVYEKYQAQIDQYLDLIRTQVNSVVGKIQEKIPGAKRKAE